eukprot:832456_1
MINLLFFPFYGCVLCIAQHNEHIQHLPKQTPVMGFNTWNSFRCAINETLILKTADLLISTGLSSVGYQYVNIDDCWSLKERHPISNNIQYDPVKFPNGIRYIADYIHKKHLKFGLYSDAGTMTCAGYPGSVLHEDLDAQLFINEYDIDLLKYDWCHHREKDNINTSFTAYVDYNTMRTALRTHGDGKGKHIVFSLCNWGQVGVKHWGNMLGDSWRISGDIFPFFDFKQRWEQCLSKMRWCHLSIMEIVDEAAAYYDQVTCGHFMDLDMMVVGFYDGMSIGSAGEWFYKIGGLSYFEQETHFILWCLFQSPLIIGYDLAKMDRAILTLLKHKALIGVNQDALCKPPKLIKTIGSDYQCSIQLFLKHVQSNDSNMKLMLNVLNRDYQEHSNVYVYFGWIMDEINDNYAHGSRLVDMDVTLHIRDVMKDEEIGAFYCCRNLNEYVIISKIGVHQSILYQIEITENSHNRVVATNAILILSIIIAIALVFFYKSELLRRYNQCRYKKRSALFF